MNWEASPGRGFLRLKKDYRIFLSARNIGCDSRMDIHYKLTFSAHLNTDLVGG